MGWKQYARQIEAAHRRSARATARWQKEVEKRRRESEKQAAKDAAAREVAEFEEYLVKLTSLHTECTPPLDWAAIARSPEPAPPQRATTRERAARDVLDTYAPGFFDRLFGAAKKRSAVLQENIERARAEDAANHRKQEQQHAQDVTEWQLEVRLAQGILARNPNAYLQALDYLSAFDAVEAFQTVVRISTAEAELLVVTCEIKDSELVPDEEIKLTAAGKVSTKAMAGGRRWTLYQDHVCSCALRIAREVFGALPVSRVIVNISEGQLDTSTGHVRPVTTLATHFLRTNLERLKFSTLDPSDAMRNLSHRMKFKKTSGFEPVEPITTDENWVTAG